MRLFLVLLMLLVPAMAQAQAKVFGLALAANGVWFDDDTSPADFELGAAVKASLSPHISAVGDLAYGVDHSYIRGAAGVRVTATDVDNKNFSVGLGIQYHVCNKEELRPEEWAPDATVGWRPWPNVPEVVLIARGQYGLTSNEALALVGVRYVLGGR